MREKLHAHHHHSSNSTWLGGHHRQTTLTHYKDKKPLKEVIKKAIKKAISHSHTQTDECQEKQKFKANDLHGGVNDQYHHIVVKKQKPKSVGGSYLHYYHDYTRTLPGDPGVSTLYECMLMGCTSQWLTSTNPPVSSGDAFPSYFDQQYNRYVSGSSLYGAALPSADRFCLSSSLTWIDIANFSTLVTWVKIHVFVANHDTDVTPLGAYANNAFSEALGVTALADPSGVSDNYLTGSSGVKYTAGPAATTTSLGNKINVRVGSVIRSVRGAKFHWRLAKTVAVDLAASGVERVKISIVHNNMKNRNNLNESGTAFPKGTVWFVVEQSVQPVVVNAVAENPQHGTGQIGVIFKNHIKFQMVKASSSRLETALFAEQERANTGAAKQILATDAQGVASYAG